MNSFFLLYIFSCTFPAFAKSILLQIFTFTFGRLNFDKYWNFGPKEIREPKCSISFSALQSIETWKTSTASNKSITVLEMVYVQYSKYKTSIISQMWQQIGKLESWELSVLTKRMDVSGKVTYSNLRFEKLVIIFQL